jgi:uncharacterized protein (TIGR02118 family)
LGELAVADFVYEIVCTGDRSHRDAVRSWLRTRAAPVWAALPGSSAVDVYDLVEDGANDPLAEADPGPLLLAMLQFPTVDALSAAVADRRFRDSLAAHPAAAAITGTTLERRFYPVDGEEAPGPLRAGFSYVVRYHQPAQDEAHFIAHYLANHPPLLAKLPQIRSVLCYLPVRGATPGILPAADYIIGNEVAFDSIGAFNAAMASPVRKELRAHFREFPPFAGRNTHFPMVRAPLARPSATASA